MTAFQKQAVRVFPASFTGLMHEPGYYLRNNMYVAPGGIFTPALPEYCVNMPGIDRIMFSLDFPRVSAEGADQFLNHPSLSVEDREKIAYRNAEKLLQLSTEI